MSRRSFTPRGVPSTFAILARNARCSRSSNSLSARHAASVALPFSGRGKKLLPFNTNAPRFPPSIRLRTAYFQYAACRVSSQILCRPAPGRHAACFALTPRIACLKLGPCQVFLLYASSNSVNTSSRVFTVCPRQRSLLPRCKSPSSSATGSASPHR